MFRIRIADHHFLHPALGAGAAADNGQRQKFAHDGGSGAQIRNRLEQRYNRQDAGLDARRIAEQSGFLGDKIGAENVSRRTCHAENETPECLPVELFGLVGGKLEHAKRFQRLGRQFRPLAICRERPGKLGHDPAFPLGRRRIGRRFAFVSGGSLPQRLQSLGQTCAVFPQIKPDGAEAEDLHRPPDRAHKVTGEIAARAFRQRILENF